MNTSPLSIFDHTGAYAPARLVGLFTKQIRNRVVAVRPGISRTGAASPVTPSGRRSPFPGRTSSSRRAPRPTASRETIARLCSSAPTRRRRPGLTPSHVRLVVCLRGCRLLSLLRCFREQVLRWSTESCPFAFFLGPPKYLPTAWTT